MNLIKCLDEVGIEALACACKFSLYMYVYDETVGKMRNCVIRNVKCEMKNAQR